MRRCLDCNGSGITTTPYYSVEAGKMIMRLGDCYRCDGVGRHHECEFVWCKTHRGWVDDRRRPKH